MKITSSQGIWNRLWKSWQRTGTLGLLTTAWAYSWMQFAGLSPFGRMATYFATWVVPPYKGRRRLARYSVKGYTSPSAAVSHADLQLGKNVFIGDRVMIFQDKEGGTVELGERVHLYFDTCLQTGYNGSLKIGSNTFVQPRCHFSAYKAPISIGCGVQIAPSCAFYSYAHGMAPGQLIEHQPLQTKGGITVKDDAWLGHGVIVLDGVCIGKGAVVGAGAVVTQDIPDGAIATGVPARVINMRADLISSGNGAPQKQVH